MLLAHQDIRDALRAKLKHDNFTVETFSIDEVDTLHFHSDNHVVQITARVRDKLEDYSFFLKSVDVDSDIFKRFLGPTKLFEKEHDALTEVISYLQTVAPRKITAECYLSKHLKFIVLENLAPLGFKPLGRFVDVRHARVAIEALANLHAASFIKEEKEGVSLGEKFKNQIYETLAIWKKLPEESLVQSIDTRLRETGRRYFTHLSLDTLNKLFDRMRTANIEMCQTSVRFRNVITQGDPWGGNLLFNYDDDDNPREALLVDFQTIRYGPPAQKLLSFLHIATPDSQFISDHSEDLKELYYERLSHFMSERDVDISNVLPKNEFLESCEVYREYGIALRVYYASNTRVPPKYFSTIAKSQKSYCDFMVGGSYEVALEAYKNDAQYKKEIDESIKAAVQFYQDL